MKNKEIEYGNITLGKINKMLISFIGESTFYYYCEEFAKEGLIENWQSKEAFQKYVNRLVAEEDSDFAGLNVANNTSIPVLVCKVLDRLATDYLCSQFFIESIKKLAYDLYEGYKNNQYPIYETYNFYRAFFCKNYKDYVKILISSFVKAPEIIKMLPVFFCSSVKKYNIAYDFLAEIPDFGSKEKLYSKLADYYSDDEKQEEHFKQIITNQMKDARNPKWINMKEILDFLMQNKGQSIAASWLIEAYLLSNIEKFIREETGILEEQIQKLFSSGSNIYSLPPNPQKFFEEMDELEYDGMDKKKFDENVESIKKALNAVFNDHIYLYDENQTKDFIEEVRLKVPEASKFYCTWMEGYIQLAKDNVLGALKKYKDAFEYRNFAGSQLESFIKQAIALSIFANSTDIMVREAVDPSKNRTTPLKNDAKKYWNYGYALGIFEKPAEDTFIENVYKTSNFLSVFSESMFIKSSKIKQDLSGSYIKDVGIDCTKVPEGSTFSEQIKKDIDNDYERLSKLTNENINTRIRMYNHEVQPAIPPLTLAIYHAAPPNYDMRFILLIKSWLGFGDENSFENLNVNSVSDKGTTPLQAALRAYRDSKHHNRNDFAQEFKTIALAIIEKSSIESFTVKSVKTRREALQEAIDSYDLDLVKAIIEKGLDVNGLLISADDVSPVYYCIQRFKQAKFPDKFINQISNFDESTNMVWENLNMPGLTNSDKKKMYFNTETPFGNKELLEKFAKAAFIKDMGPESTYQEQQKQLRAICLYLIEKTANQDEFIKENREINQKWTSLFFAAEADDKDICKALLKNGADPNLHLGIAPEWGDITFIKRCISYEAWEVLEMFLSEFCDLARVSINESDYMYQPSPFIAFLSMMLKIRETNAGKYKGRDFVLHMANLFGQCGASYNQPSIYGSANELLKFI